MNEYIHSIRNGKMHNFRKRYREDCDVLLLDDIQFIANKDSTQEEFFHTFNALYEQHRQIVLSADRKPHEIPDIADRLRTRFAWGLMADIEPPELEVRVAILRKKAEAESISLPDEVSLYIASAGQVERPRARGRADSPRGVRVAVASENITLEFARETLEGSIARPSEHISVEQVLKAVAELLPGQDPGPQERAPAQVHLPRPRAVAMFLARKHTGESYPDLGPCVRQQAPHDGALRLRQDHRDG